MTEKKPKTDPLRYIVVDGSGKIFGVFPTKAAVCKQINEDRPMRATISERDEDCKYRVVATFAAGAYIKDKFEF